MFLRRRLQKPNSTLKIRILGDSLTTGWGLDGSGFGEYFQDSYCSRLKQLLLSRFPNASIDLNTLGIPGGTLKGCKIYAKKTLIDDHPDIAILQFGLNDSASEAMSGTGPVDFECDVEQIIKDISDESPNTTRVILVPAPPLPSSEYSVMAEPYRAAMKSIAENGVDNYDGKQVDVVLADLTGAFGSASSFEEELFQRDGVHPTAKGHEVMAEAVYHAIFVDLD